MGYTEYMDAITRFNDMGTFIIEKPKPDDHHIFSYEKEVREKIHDLLRYESIREKGYSDDHLATEIGLFVLHLNRETLNIMSPRRKTQQ